ncbi:ATP-dependent nuclease [Thalassolituus maritimus]|uniref:ATP-dependent endonuclease n=1 Tax=Thalassolituus maritimus TaxID=484498 RepID=A0ABQ0A090_9GAMM
MSHKLSEVQIKNFKSCINTELKLSGYTPLIGYNNAGKSNALTAIQWLLKKTSLGLDDFFDRASPVEVIGVIEGISQDLLGQMNANHRSSIENYITDEKLKIRRVQLTPNAKAAEIRISVWSDTEQDWVPNPNGIDNALKSILPEPIRIGAMENAAEDASKAKSTTTIGKLLAEFLEPVRAAHEVELAGHLGEVSRRISSDGDMRFGELAVIDQNVNRRIDDLFPGMSLKLHFETPTFDELIKSGSIKVYENQNQGRDFSSYGHGAQRSIQMALVQYLAEVKRGAGGQLTTTLLLIDEPELYLHPFAVEQIRQALLALSQNGYQVVLSTHSAQMVTSDQAKYSLLIRKNTQRGTYARVRLADAIQALVPDSVHQMEQLFSLSHSTQVLFAEQVALTEGKTELRLLPFIFETASGRTLGQEKLALVAQSGVSDTRKSLDILDAMDLPAKAIVDLDYAFTRAINDGYLQDTDPDINALKIILQRLEQQGAITLHTNGLPKKGVVKPSKAFELLANEQDAVIHIENLHNRLKAQGIWVWTKGAIEAHIGTASKDELAWSQFKASVDSDGLEATCPQHQTLIDLVSWLRV